MDKKYFEKVILSHPKDNVATARSPIKSGTSLTVSKGKTIISKEEIPFVILLDMHLPHVSGGEPEAVGGGSPRNQKISKETAPKSLWSGTFLRLPNSKPMASFAQDRTYYYNGKEVDRQIHWGVDLASLAQSSVPAANSGIAVFAGPLGIYGNTVIIDHGDHTFTVSAYCSQLLKKLEILFPRRTDCAGG
jgi:murein DD-endopeptidase MepM/ murein hydrolase activator NlpD